MPISYVPYKLTLGSETTIYQNEVKCRVLENDFNYSQNPTVFAESVIFDPTQQYLLAENDDFLLAENDENLVAFNPLPYYYPTNGNLIDNVTGSAFHPYATTIGLYNDSNELLVVGKLATPYPIPSDTDITFIVRWDS